MSASPTWTIWCDAELPDCWHWCQQTEMRASAARRNALAEGWHQRPGNRDICPNCWKAGAR